MNNRAWFYSVDTRQLVNQKEYHGTVSQAVLGADYAAVRVEGQVRVHRSCFTIMRASES